MLGIELASARRARYAVTCLAVAACTPGCPNSAEVVADSTPPVTASHAGDVVEPIYDQGLKGSWQVLGSAPVGADGGAAAQVRFAEGIEWVLARPGLTGDFGALTFRTKGIPGEGEFIEVGLRAGTTPASQPPHPAFVKISPDHKTALGDDWVQVTIPMDQLDPDRRPFDCIVFRAFRPVADASVPIDKIGLLRAGPSTAGVASGGVVSGGAIARPVAASTPATGTPTPMRIACDAPAIKISPFIYGVGGTDPGKTDLGATIYRWGGNRTTRYNWEIHVDNSASDWFFENAKAGDWTTFLETVLQRGRSSAMTLPIGGWVAKDSTSAAFPVSLFGPQGRTDPYRSDNGDGTKPGGAKIPPGPPERTSVAAPPEFIKRWVEAIRALDAKSGKRSVGEYILDNEPMLWMATHRDIHPDPMGYDELLDRTIRYGTAVRQADPDAMIAGPAEWGWSNYLYSNKDLAPGVFGKPDRAAHGGLALVEWYLQKLRDYEKQSKVRVLDVLDLHYYPQESGVYSDASDAKTAELRLRSTRSLWDPTYVDESWIKESVHLLPRMKEWVEKNYPGRGISIGEWSFGGEKHVSGALATAEALGRFAQFGVRSAFYWTAPPEGSASAQGFAAYRNFDGKGGRFLDYYVPTTTPAGVSLFASRDEEGKHMVVVAINMSADTARLSQIDVGACGAIASRRAFIYSEAAAGFVPQAPVQSGPSTTLEQGLPPWSITVIDLGLAQALPRNFAP
jgi:hypothetical protein